MTTEEVLSTLKVGDYVTHSNHEDWGKAIVKRISGSSVFILFNNPGAGYYNTNCYNASCDYITKVSSSNDIIILLL
jgi:calcineurin-like phosphoesterase family protein